MRRLERYLVKGGKRLRLGYTTGSCAAAAALGAARLLLGASPAALVQIQAPGGAALLLELEEQTLTPQSARCSVRKDGGDDPDITDGALIGCTVSRIPSGFLVEGGAGVGRITRPGLSRGVGEAAINPVPLEMIREQLVRAAKEAGYPGGLEAVVDVPQGEELARRTFNPRLGILGGISILGTTGLVEPMSRRALIATIRAEVDSRAAAGATTLLAVPGNYGQDFARSRWGISLDQGVKCSNYIGEAVDYAAYKGFRRFLLLGHGGKLVKVAAGIMDTHSRTADARMEILAAHAGLQGLGPEGIAALMDCPTVDGADDLLAGWGIADAVWASVARRAAEHLERRAGPGMAVAFAAFGRRGLLMEGGPLEQWVKDLAPADN